MFVFSSPGYPGEGGELPVLGMAAIKRVGISIPAPIDPASCIMYSVFVMEPLLTGPGDTRAAGEAANDKLAGAGHGGPFNSWLSVAAGTALEIPPPPPDDHDHRTAGAFRCLLARDRSRYSKVY